MKLLISILLLRFGSSLCQPSWLNFLLGRSSRIHFSPFRLVAFGDSTTDDGVLYPNDPYGFNRFSNGPVWVDYLAESLKIDNISNFAYAGAFSDYGNYYGHDWSGGLWQVEEYLKVRKTIRRNCISIFTS